MGALPESQLRGFVERLIGPVEGGSDRLAEAEAALAQGDAAGAAQIFAELVKDDPNDAAAVSGLARARTALGDLESARSLLAQLPATVQEPSVVAARAALENAAQAASVGDLSELAVQLLAEPNNHKARLDLAVALNALGRKAEAADALIEIVKRDRTWNDDGGRKQLLQFFDAWGPTDPDTIAARRKLSALLFS
jgi:putative thioredoxin